MPTRRTVLELALAAGAAPRPERLDADPPRAARFRRGPVHGIMPAPPPGPDRPTRRRRPRSRRRRRRPPRSQHGRRHRRPLRRDRGGRPLPRRPPPRPGRHGRRLPPRRRARRPALQRPAAPRPPRADRLEVGLWRPRPRRLCPQRPQPLRAVPAGAAHPAAGGRRPTPTLAPGPPTRPPWRRTTGSSRGSGSYVAAAVWAHYHAFEREVIAALPFAGGTIRGDDIRAWLRARGVEPKA